MRDGAFFGGAGILPLQTACRCVCRGVCIGRVRYRISRHVRYVAVALTLIAGGSIVGDSAPRSAGRMKKPLVKVRFASGFSYVGYVDGAGLVDGPRGYRDRAAGSGRWRTLCRRSCRRTGDQTALFSKVPIRAVLFHLAIARSKIAGNAILPASMLAVSCRIQNSAILAFREIRYVPAVVFGRRQSD